MVESSETPMYSVEQWKVVEVTLVSSKSYENPWKEIEVDAEFSSSGGTTIKRPGFWDGGNRWKVRFAPVHTGTWTYSTTCSDEENEGLQGHSGVVKCVPYTGNLSIYKHGFLNTSADGRYFVHEDNTPFFYLGDTHWLMGAEKWEDSNLPGTTSQFRHMVDKRVEQGYTVYQSEAIGANGGWKEGIIEDNIGTLQDLDRKFQYIAEKGLVHATALGCHNSIIGWCDPRRLGRMWSARYGAYPVLWTTGQEVDLYPEALSLWQQVAEGIAAADDYKHPLSGHLYITEKNFIWAQEDWHGWFATQGGHGRICTKEHYKAYWEYAPAKPFLEYEANYENLENAAELIRKAAYKAIQCGSPGFGYGSQGVWNDDYAPDERPCKYGPYHYWADGLDAPGGSQMTFLISFYTSLPWWRLVPRFDEPAWAHFANPEDACLKTDGSDLYVVYFLNDGVGTGVLRNMKDAAYTGKWFDPEEGCYLPLSLDITPSGGEWIIPRKPDSSDWVLLVELAAK